MLDKFYSVPAFCGEIPAGSSENIFEICAREVTLFVTYVLRAEKTEGVCDDLWDEDCYGEGEFITHFAETIGDGICDTLPCDASAFLDPLETVDQFYMVEGNYNERGCGPEPLSGNADYA